MGAAWAVPVAPAERVARATMVERVARAGFPEPTKVVAVAAVAAALQ